MTRRIDPGLIPLRPNLDFEHTFWQQGITLVAGIDEAGRGALAGPVAAASVILPPREEILPILSGVLDSKQLTPSVREGLRRLIESNSRTWGVGFASQTEIDQTGIVNATRLAIQRALDKMDLDPQHLLIDYLVLPDNPIPQTRLTKGDARSLSIAAASILAKTHRDALMISLADEYPAYNFKANKGYGTAQHREIIQTKGPCHLHRMTFAPIREIGKSS